MKKHKFSSMSEVATFLADQACEVYHVMVLHDDDCTPSSCTCKPDYVVEIATPDNVMAGAKAERAWRKAKAS
jgi:hypothetical protein